MKTFIKNIIHLFSYIVSYIFNFKILVAINYLIDNVYSYSVKRSLLYAGKSFRVGFSAVIIGNKHINIGNGFFSHKRLRMEAITKYGNQSFNPQINIGDNVIINYDCHIGCINKIEIGNNVLIASRVFITDHFHGKIDYSELITPPTKRHLHSKGGIIIKDNVWIGEGAVILPNVTLGKNVIVGANSVVTKSFEENSVIGGIPAKLIRKLS